MTNIYMSATMTSLKSKRVPKKSSMIGGSDRIRICFLIHCFIIIPVRVDASTLNGSVVIIIAKIGNVRKKIDRLSVQ